MYAGDWLLRLSQFVRAADRPAVARVPGAVWGLGLTSMLTDISSEMVVSVLPAYIVLAGGLAPAALGLATGVHEGGPLLALWLGGLIADRSGRRKLIAGLGYGVSALCRVGWLALPGRTMTGITGLILADRIGKAVRTAPRDAIISLSVAPGQLATAFGVHRALDAAGAALGPLLAFALLWWLPRRYDVVFFASLVAAALGVAALWLLVDEPRADPSTRPRASEAFSAFADPTVRRILGAALAFSLVAIGDAFVYLLLVSRGQGNPIWIPLLYTGTSGAFLALAVPIGVLADRVGRWRVFILGHMPLLGAYAVAFTASGRWTASAVLCVLFLGCYYASTEGVLAGLASAALPSNTRSVGLAWVRSAIGAGRAGSAVIVGLLWTKAGDSLTVSAFSLALVAAMGLALVALPMSSDDREASL